MEELEQITEEQLIRDAKASPEGFGALYDRYFDIVFHYVLKRTGDLDLAQDLTSDTFMKVLHYLPRYTYTGVPFSCWLYRIAINQINQHFRKKSIFYFDFLDPKDEPSIKETPEDEVKAFEEEKSKKVEFTLMMEYIKKLPTIDQSIITLRYFEDRKFSEIGQILTIREGTVKVRMNRALMKLQRWMAGTV